MDKNYVYAEGRYRLLLLEGTDIRCRDQHDSTPRQTVYVKNGALHFRRDRRPDHPGFSRLIIMDGKPVLTPSGDSRLIHSSIPDLIRANIEIRRPSTKGWKDLATAVWYIADDWSLWNNPKILPKGLSDHRSQPGCWCLLEGGSCQLSEGLHLLFLPDGTYMFHEIWGSSEHAKTMVVKNGHIHNRYLGHPIAVNTVQEYLIATGDDHLADMTSLWDNILVKRPNDTKYHLARHLFFPKL